jgi:hypothetical protein
VVVLNKTALVVVCIIVIVLAVGAIGFQIYRGRGGAVDQETGEEFVEPTEGAPIQVPPSPDPGSVNQ